VPGIKSWRFTEGGADARATGRAGAGGGAGYGFRSQPHVCFCGVDPCKHGEFIGESTLHRVYACTQEKTDRELTTSFISSIDKDTALASAGDLKDSMARDLLPTRTLASRAAIQAAHY
jgi:hypothetical protein